MPPGARGSIVEAYYTTTQPAVISPSSGGAANWAPKAYSPNTRLVYMPVSGFSSRTYVAIPFDLTAGRSIQNNGTPRGGRMPVQVTSAPVTSPYIGPPRSLTGGYVVAFDPATRSERWRVDGGGGSGGGVLVTASNLVFQTVNDGRLRALSAEDGTMVWELPDRPARHGTANHLSAGWAAAHFVHGWRRRRRQFPTDGVHVRARWEGANANDHLAMRPVRLLQPAG